jgi:hypothetical protein
MAFAYINTRGVPYTLHEQITTLPDGDLRRLYYFCKEQRDGALDEIPEGFEITENQYGLPLLRRSHSKPNGISEIISSFF